VAESRAGCGRVGDETRRGRLESVDRDIWIADGPAVPFFGIPYPTRAAVVRLPDGGLWVWSPIRLDEGLASEVIALGPVRHLVAPNKIHHLFLAAWQERWPDALLWAAPGLRRRRPDLRFDGDLGDEPDRAWADAIDQVIFRGSLAMEEAVFFHRPSRTAIFTDLIQRFDPATLRGWRRLVMRLDGLVGPGGSTPREWRLSFLDRRAARRAKAKALAWDPERVIVAHGDWARSDGRRVVERGLAWL
jgi:Domain of unknown function (DUF4336)